MSDGSPSMIVGNVGELYEPLVGDYLDAHGQFGDPIRSLPLADAGRVVCAALKGGYSVLGEIQDGGAVGGPKRDCVGKQEEWISIGRFSWEVFRLSSGKVLATRTAHTGWPGGLMALGHHIDAEERDGLVLTIVSSRVWRCPFDPDDPCGTFDVSPTGESEIRCLMDEKTLCKEDGANSEVYVTEIVSGRSLRFGDFVRRPAPLVAVTAEQVIVTAGDCTQSAKRPWGGAP